MQLKKMAFPEKELLDLRSLIKKPCEEEARLNSELSTLLQRKLEKSQSYLSKTQSVESNVIGKLMVCNSPFKANHMRLYPANERIAMMQQWIQNYCGEVLSVKVNMVLQFEDIDWAQHFDEAECSLAFMVADINVLHSLRDGSFVKNTMGLKLDVMLDPDSLEDSGNSYVVVFYVSRNCFDASESASIRIHRDDLLTSTMPASVIVMTKNSLF